MKLLIAMLAAIGAATAGVFLWRKYHKSAEAAWGEATDSVSAWSKTATVKATETTAKLAETTAEAADEVAATAHKAAAATADVAANAKGASSE